jgi:hypothetical protein
VTGQATIAVSDIEAVKRAAAASGKSVDGVMPDSMIIRDPNDYAVS